MAGKKVTKKKKNDQTALINNFVLGYLGRLKGWPEPEENLIVFTDANGQRLVYSCDEKEQVKLVPSATLYQYLVRYAQLQLCKEEFQLTPKLAAEIAKQWLSVSESKPIAEIKSYRFASESGYCIQRIDWDIKAGPTPLFDELVSRVSNPEAFKAFIGSLFVPESDRQQYLWVWGEGQNGKGALSRLLYRVFGEAYGSKSIPGKNKSAHWEQSLVNKRLVVFPDVNGGGWIRTGELKTFTGGDIIEINPKNMPAYSTELECKFMFLSNYPPTIGPLDADRRRALICYIEKPTELVKNYEKRLWDEAPALIHKCIASYHATVDSQGNIPVPEESFGDASDWISNECAAFWHKWFILPNEQDLKMWPEKCYVKAADIQTKMTLENISIKQSHDYYRWLQLRHPDVKRGVIRCKKDVFKGCKNLILRDIPYVKNNKFEAFTLGLCGHENTQVDKTIEHIDHWQRNR